VLSSNLSNCTQRLSWRRIDCARPTTLDERGQSKRFSAANTPCKHAHDGFKLCTAGASLPRSLVELPATYALSRTACFSHNYKGLFEYVSCILQRQQEYGHVKSVLNDLHAEKF
jgi:hypothetical protein